MKKDANLFQKNLIFLIESSNFTMTTVAKKAGINKSTLHNYLNGVSLRPLKTVESLASFFKIPPEDLLYKDLGATDIRTELQPTPTSSYSFEVTIKPVDMERLLHALQQKL